MKKLIILAVLIALVVFVWPKLKEVMTTSEGAKAEKRVEAMLKAWALGGTSNSTEAQTAACQFAEGRSLLSDRDGVALASDKFDKFRIRKNLYKKIKDYKILDVTESADGNSATVNCEIDGKQYSMVVIEGEPIRWAE